MSIKTVKCYCNHADIICLYIEVFILMYGYCIPNSMTLKCFHSILQITDF